MPHERKDTTTMTEWRDIPGYPGYQASADGQIRSLDRTQTNSRGHQRRLRGKILNPWLDPDGYLRVAPKQTPIGVNRLVCLAFHGDPPVSAHAAHRNGDKLDNTVGNLYWATSSENELDKVRHGGNPQAVKTHCPSGHSYSLENTYWSPKGWRQCRACKRERDRIYAKNQVRRAVNA